MFILNSPLSQFEVTNLFGIVAPIFGQFNIILTNLSLYTFFPLDSSNKKNAYYGTLTVTLPLVWFAYIIDFFNFFFNCYLYCKDIFIIFPIVILCGIIFTGVGFIISYSGRRVVEQIIRNSGTIGTVTVGLVTGLDAALNLNDRLKKKKQKKRRF